MKPRVLPQLPDLETESETVHTWELEDWRNLPRKARGPVFECGGHPWYVGPRSRDTSTVVVLCTLAER